MPKERLTCFDCAFCQGNPALARVLCWRPFDGPEVVVAVEGFCGDELPIDDEEGTIDLVPSQLWAQGHEHSPEVLAEVLTLLRLAGLTVPAQGEGEEVQESEGEGS